MIDLLIITKGILFTIGLIAGIGPQSLFLIEQSLKKNANLIAAFTCFFCDVILLMLSALLIGTSKNLTLIYILNIIGVVFICYFIIKKIIRIFFKRYNVEIITDNDSINSIIIKGIIFTWFNPMVYLDIFVIIGRIMSGYDGYKFTNFFIGTVIGDFFWVFGLSFLVRIFSYKLIRNSKTFLILDIFTVLIMSFIVYRIIESFLGQQI